MFPVLIRVGAFQVNAYMACLCIAFCVSLFLVLRAASREREVMPVSPLFGVWVFLGAMQGARMWHVVQRTGWSAWREMLNPWEGGLAFHGGLVGGLLAGLAYAVCVGVPFLALGIRAVDAASAGHSFHRLDDGALAAVSGGKVCRCVDHKCVTNSLPFACVLVPGSWLTRDCEGCDTPFELFGSGYYDVCTRISGLGCCDNDVDCVPKCEKKCPVETHYSSKDCSLHRKDCAVANHCHYSTDPPQPRG